MYFTITDNRRLIYVYKKYLHVKCKAIIIKSFFLFAELDRVWSDVIQDIVGEFETQYILCVEYSNRIYSNMIYVPLLYIELNFAGEKLKIF